MKTNYRLLGLFVFCLVVALVLPLVQSIDTIDPTNNPTSSLQSTPSIQLPSFFDDTIPLESDLDCGEATSMLQRTLQLELAIKTNKHNVLVGQHSDPFYTSRLQSFDLSDDHSLNHFWFASCNHQNRAQALWYHFYRRTIEQVTKPTKKTETAKSTQSTPTPQSLNIPNNSPSIPMNPLESTTLEPIEATPIDPGQLFLWLGDAIYLDRPPLPNPFPPNSQRADATRQQWRKHYCSAVRRQIPQNGMVDDHDFGLNNAHSDFVQKYRTKQLFLDFLDLPDPVELGAARQFNDIATLLCGTAIGCIDEEALFNPGSKKETKMDGRETKMGKMDKMAQKTAKMNKIADNDMKSQSEEMLPDQSLVDSIIEDVVQDNYDDLHGLMKSSVDDTCKNTIISTVKDIHSLTIAENYKALSAKYSGAVLDACYVNYNAVNRFDGDEKSHYAKSRQFKSPSVFDQSIDLSPLFNLDHHTESITDSSTSNPSGGKIETQGVGDKNVQNVKKDSKSQKNIPETHLTPLQSPTDSLSLRRTFESSLEAGYKSRRGRHGTHDVNVYGPLFRRVKTILVDIRVSAIDNVRQLAEPGWKWVREALMSSVIPSLEEVFFATNRREGLNVQNGKKMNPNEQQNDQNDQNSLKNDQNSLEFQQQSIGDDDKIKFLDTIDKLRLFYTKFEKNTGQMVLDSKKLQDDMKRASSDPSSSNPTPHLNFNTLSTDYQCNNDVFHSNNFMKLLSGYQNGIYLKKGADIVLVASGILISSWGKYFSEGWRTTPGDRSRMLELSARVMALSRQNVDEWKLFFQSREIICSQSIPLVTFRDDPYKHNASTRFLAQVQTTGSFGASSEQDIPHFSRIPIINAIKPIAVVYLTGDIHYAEAARTYLPFDSSAQEPAVVSNTPDDVTIETLYDDLSQEVGFLLSNDTKTNGDNVHKNVLSYSQIINKEVGEIISGDYDLEDVLESDRKRLVDKDGQINRHFLSTKQPNTSQPTTTATKVSKTKAMLKKLSSTVNGGDVDVNFTESGAKDDEEETVLLPYSTLFDRYIAPLSDITTSGITHAWGGHSSSSPTKEYAIRTLFNTVLRPKVTNIDYTSKHSWLIDELERSYSSQLKSVARIPLDKATFELMRSQSRVFIYHNMGEITVDWDNDIIHLIVKNVTLAPALYFSSPLEHHRAYSIPQLMSFKDRGANAMVLGEKNDQNLHVSTLSTAALERAASIYDEMEEENVSCQNDMMMQGITHHQEQNDAKGYKKIKKLTPLKSFFASPLASSDTKPTSLDLYLRDMQLQLIAESSTRFKVGGDLTKAKIFGIFVLILTLLIILLVLLRAFYSKCIRGLCCPERHEKKVEEKMEKRMRRGMMMDGQLDHPDVYSDYATDPSLYDRFEGEEDGSVGTGNGAGEVKGERDINNIDGLADSSSFLTSSNNGSDRKMTVSPSQPKLLTAPLDNNNIRKEQKGDRKNNSDGSSFMELADLSTTAIHEIENE